MFVLPPLFFCCPPSTFLSLFSFSPLLLPSSSFPLLLPLLSHSSPLLISFLLLLFLSFLLLSSLFVLHVTVKLFLLFTFFLLPFSSTSLLISSVPLLILASSSPLPSLSLPHLPPFFLLPTSFPPSFPLISVLPMTYWRMQGLRECTKL